MEKTSTDVVREHLEGRFARTTSHTARVAHELDAARCLAAERKGAIVALESRVNVQKSHLGDLQRKLDHAESLLGELTPEHVRLVAEVLEQAVGLRDRCGGPLRAVLTSEALDEFAKAVNEMEEANP